MGAIPNIVTPSAAAGILAGVIAATIWSGWYVLARYGVTAGGMNSYDLAALRFLVAAPLLLLIMRRFPFPARSLPLAVIMAIGAGPAFVIVVGNGFLQAPANFGGALTAVCGVIFTLLGGTFVLRERLSRAQKQGILVAVLGLTFLAATADGGGRFAYFVGGGLLWASYSIAFRRSGLTALQAVTSVAVISAVVYLPAYFAVSGSRLWLTDPAELFLQGIGQGVLTGIVALALHARAVAALGAIRGALFQSLVPVFTMILAFAFLGEIPRPSEMGAICVILVGVYIALRYRAEAMK